MAEATVTEGGPAGASAGEPGPRGEGPTGSVRRSPPLVAVATSAAGPDEGPT